MNHYCHAMCLIQPITDQLVSWGLTQGLRFNPTKTIFMLFSRDTDKTLV